MNTPRRLTCALLPLLFATVASASSQHSPLIERMTDSPANTTASVTPSTQATAVQAPAAQADSGRSAPTEIGGATRALLRMQADANRPGNPLPMLGEAASRSYQRYLNSFDHPIPEYFEATLPSSDQSSSR